MKKKIWTIIKKQWLLMLSAIMAVAMTSIIAFAEYKSATSNMHRVVVSKKAPGMMFSSNYLTVDGDGIFHPIYVQPKSDERYSSNYLYIWNYNTSDIGRRYQENINYKLEFVLTDQGGNPIDASAVGTCNIRIVDPLNRQIELNDTNLSNSFKDATQQILAKESTQNKYTISFSSNWDFEANENICVSIKATPTQRDSGGSYMDLVPISGVIGLRTSSSTQVNGWKASISEQPEDGQTTPAPSAYDAYNLVLTGSGSATITVKWDPTKIELNRFFTSPADRVYTFASGEIDGPTQDASGWMVMTIHADTGNNAQENRNRYTIQMYKTGAEEPSDWRFFANNKADDVQENAWIRVNIT